MLQEMGCYKIDGCCKRCVLTIDRLLQEMGCYHRWVVARDGLLQDRWVVAIDGLLQ